MTAIIPLPLLERERRAALARISGRDSQRPTFADWRMLAQHGASAEAAARRERERAEMDHFEFGPKP